MEFTKLTLLKVLTKIPGCSQIKSICGLFIGTISNGDESIDDLCLGDVFSFNYAP